MQQTSFHVNGFWFHVKWDAQGKVGKDQHGGIWYNMQNPRSEMGGMRPKPDRSKGPSSNKDYFLQQRESYHEYFHTRSAMMK
jgi:hypothetical protein